MPRVRIADIVRETGLSRSTVDRALNRRGQVHPRTLALIEEARHRLARTVPPPTPPPPPIDLVLRVGRGMTGQLERAWHALDREGAFHDLHGARDGEVVERVRRLCATVERPLVVTAKNTEPLVDTLREARERGKRVVALISDLAPEARCAFVGVDDRAAGRTAAYLVAKALGPRPARVGIVVGDVAFRCHEDREIGFRTGLRALAPELAIAAEAQGEDRADTTREAVARMLAGEPELAAIYNVGGGNAGLAEALRASGRAGRILVVAHEVNAVTGPLLREGLIGFALAADPAVQLAEAVRLAGAASLEGRRTVRLLDLAVYTPCNPPRRLGSPPGRDEAEPATGSDAF